MPIYLRKLTKLQTYSTQQTSLHTSPHSISYYSRLFGNNLWQSCQQPVFRPWNSLTETRNFLVSCWQVLLYDLWTRNHMFLYTWCWELKFTSTGHSVDFVCMARVISNSYVSWELRFCELFLLQHYHYSQRNNPQAHCSNLLRARGVKLRTTAQATCFFYINSPPRGELNVNQSYTSFGRKIAFIGMGKWKHVVFIALSVWRR